LRVRKAAGGEPEFSPDVHVSFVARQQWPAIWKYVNHRMRPHAPKKVQLTVGGGSMTLPADTPYDRQVLADHLAALIRRHGVVRLTAGRRAWWLTLTDRAVQGQCDLCLRPLQYGVRHTGEGLMCIACASRRVIPSEAEREPSAA
jgi:hypothetical protein